MSTTFKFGTDGNWAVKDGYALAYNDVNNNFKPLPFDFTRASSATRVNKQGLIETVPSGKPRIDFLDNTSGHLLLEPSRTNNLVQSNGFDTTWSKTRSSVSQGYVSPEGSNNAWAFIDNTNNSTHLIAQSLSIGSAVHTFSIFAKKGTKDFMAVRFDSSTVDYAYFNLNTGTLGTIDSDYTSASMEDYGNGWYRCILTRTTGSSGNQVVIYSVEQDNDITYSGNTDNAIYIYGSQVEAGSYATSYIPTEGSSVTRVVDDADNSLPSNDAFNSSGSVSILFNIQGRELTGSNSTGNNISFEFGSSNRVAYNHNSTNYHRIEINTSGYARYITTSVLSTENVKIGVTVTATTAVVYANGVQEYSASLAATHDFTSLDSISTAITESIGNVKIKELRFYNTPLTDTELQNLTS